MANDHSKCIYLLVTQSFINGGGKNNSRSEGEGLPLTRGRLKSNSSLPLPAAGPLSYIAAAGLTCLSRKSGFLSNFPNILNQIWILD
jgi:hypothetical protein